MKPPIFVRADEALLIYATREDAARYLEWIDIEDGIYTPFDSEGRLFRFELAYTKTKLLSFIPVTSEEVVVREAEAEPTHREELRQVLIDGLAAHGEERDSLVGLSLEDLESLAVKRIGFDFP